ncbi:2-hydroxyacid dehydrogenase [Caballeronia grimmiae]|uniref:2-hydroxyacid dehydrogenase n=1 Tax=Caballeronia grimmiae TaxID=1071679 RepID=A0A069P811_9BURK|nr:2-hydroxyacid dehydrogenase [Caballeronia grimmiae]KDR33421.1 2-hydroxyacid dehydrogenase [Caballeronia grimmiae]GGD71445.1 lactate dehydrogenase [Caballeronia grimmiae]
MEVAIFSSTPYERKFLDEANKAGHHKLRYLDVQLGPDTVGLAAGFGAVCIFVNDKADAPTLEALHRGGTRLLALRCTGFNNVDLEAAARLGIKVVRVVTYSPNSVAEFAVALLLAINRKVHRAYNRTRDSNFSLDGLIGFDLFGKTVAVVGTGKIGCVFAQIMIGFGCDVIGYDPYHSAEFEALGGRYAKPGEIGSKADIVSLHCPLTPETHHIINADMLRRSKPGALLINTSRGALIDTEAVIEALKSGQLGGLAIDVYEQESSLFFRDLSNEIIQDDVMQRLVSFPNVIVTGHQAYLTREALTTICETTLQSVTAFEKNEPLENEVKAS